MKIVVQRVIAANVVINNQEYSSIKTGVFEADMKVGMVNDCPVTIILDK